MYHTDMYHIVHVYLYTHLRMHGCCLAPTTIPNHDKSMSIDVLLFSFCCVLLCFVLHVCCCFFGWLRGTEAYLWCAKYGTLVCWLYVTWRRVMAERVSFLHTGCKGPTPQIINSHGSSNGSYGGGSNVQQVVVVCRGSEIGLG